MNEQTATQLPRLRAGMTVRVHQTIQDVTPKGEQRERTQMFEGIITQTHGGTSGGASFSVYKVSHGVGVEKIFPLHLPSITKVEILKEGKVRHAKAAFLKTYKKKLKERNKK